LHSSIRLSGASAAVVSRFPNASLWLEEQIRFVCIAIAITLSLLSSKYFESPVNFFGHRLSHNAMPSIA
jgi:peptidoglycan/LPS O-acetylase OafA/YrhL